MTDLIFENYCINCEKLCSSSSLYCSSTCKLNDEANSLNLSNYTYTSPLLSPVYNEGDNYTYSYNDRLHGEKLKYEYEIDEINLDYLKSTEIISTSNNYKKWLNLLYAK